MARGQEETSTSQARHRKGPIWESPFTSSLVSSMFIEELRSYCQISDSISLELSDGLVASMVGEEDNIVYFT